MTGRIANETELIQTYLAPLAAPGAFGLMDDAALIVVEQGFDLVVTTDPIIEGVHFFADDMASDIAWKALAVNVSDLVAKGAEPIAYTMALAFPHAPLKTWMADFSAGLADAQAAFGCALIGGDTDRTTGPLSISITAMGRVPRGCFIRRQGARVGDHVFVTGAIGDAALGLKFREPGGGMQAAISKVDRRALVQRYLRPQPRLNAVQLLRQFATAALDVSDGLVQDAARLADGAGARLAMSIADVPLSPPTRAVLAAQADMIGTVVAGGDDYEVLFSVRPDNVGAVRACARDNALPIADLGVLASGAGVTVSGPDGKPLLLTVGGYDHFRGTTSAAS